MSGLQSFDGPAGLLVAPVMARMNQDMECAAAEAAVLHDGLAVLVLGCGPGVGLTEVLERCRPARMLAVDPSAAMLSAARKRVRRQHRGQAASVEFVRKTAADLKDDGAPFDVAIAVNSHQLWEPRGESTAVVGSLLRPGGTLVSLTHAWAIEKWMPLPQWRSEVEGDLLGAGLAEMSWSSATYRSGEGILVVARATCNGEVTAM